MAWPSKIYCATKTLGVYYTSNFDGINQPTWTVVNGDLPATDVRQFALDPIDPVNKQYLLLEGNRTLYRRDNGGSWASILESTGGVNVAFSLDVSIPGRIWVLFGAIVSSYDVYAKYSDDYGATWTTTEQIAVAQSMINMQAVGDNLWVSWVTGAGWKGSYSTNRGTSWTQIWTEWEPAYFVLNPLQPDRVYYGEFSDHWHISKFDTVRTLLATPCGIPRADAVWFDPIDANHQRAVCSQKLFITNDSWATTNSPSVITPYPEGIAPWAGANEDQVLVGLVLDETNSHAIGTLYGESDITATGIAGANCDSSPYTDSIPETCGGVSIGGVAAVYAFNLENNWEDSNQIVSRLIEVKWDGVNWVDETAYVLSGNTRVGITSNGVNGMPILGGGSPSWGNITLANDSGRYSRYNTTSPLHAYIQYGFMRIPIRIHLGYYDAVNGDEYVTVFTGYIYDPQEQESSGALRTVTLELRGMEADILQYKHSTLLLEGYTADQFVRAILTAAGVADQELDKGMMPIPYCWLDDENIWEQCLLLAQSEAALFWASELGYITMRRLSSLVERSECTTSQLILNRGSAWYLSNRQIAMGAYTKVVAEMVARSVGAAEVIYTSPEAIEVPINGSKEVTAQFRSGTKSIIDPVKNVDWYAVSAGVQDMSDDITIAQSLYCQRGVFTFSNANDNQTAFIYGFQIRGYPLIGEEAQTVETAADAPTLSDYWRGANAGLKELRLSGNPYIQSQQQAQLLTDLGVNWMKYPRTLIQWQGPGAPWLKPTYRVTVTDANSGIVDVDGWILDVQNAFDGKSYKQTLLILPCADLFPHTGYFIIGTAEYKDAASGKAWF